MLIIPIAFIVTGSSTIPAYTFSVFTKRDIYTFSGKRTKVLTRAALLTTGSSEDNPTI